MTCTESIQVIGVCDGVLEPHDDWRGPCLEVSKRHLALGDLYLARFRGRRGVTGTPAQGIRAVDDRSPIQVVVFSTGCCRKNRRILPADSRTNIPSTEGVSDSQSCAQRASVHRTLLNQISFLSFAKTMTPVDLHRWLFRLTDKSSPLRHLGL